MKSKKLKTEWKQFWQLLYQILKSQNDQNQDLTNPIWLPMKFELERMFIIQRISQVKILHLSLQSIQIIFRQQSWKIIF